MIVFLVTSATFFLVRLAPGDPFTREVEGSATSPEDVARQRRIHGLDRPLSIQYLDYVGKVSRGNLGVSFSERRPVTLAIAERVPATVVLAVAALLIDFALGIATGVLQGAYARSRADNVLTGITLTLYSIPVFWFGLLLVLVFALGLGWLPVGGSQSPVGFEQMTLLEQAWDRISHLILPALTLGLVGAAGTARYQRAAMQDVIRLAFIRTARAKGLTEQLVLLRHGLRNSLLPMVTLFGLSFPILLSGAVLVESVFAWPGLGRFVVQALEARDYPVITGIAIVASTMVVVGNLVADLLYRVVDPRTRQEA
ncbi:MAG: ABC transporter permease [Gemmatimonadota bacterium]|nr:MAG: ABC transporter permease [Gemmatimonadota bacterium]